MERLQKVIANSGITSRRKAEELIVNGEVSVNGEVIRELGFKVNDRDIINVMGKKIRKEVKEYYVLNKPRGYICSLSDELDRPVVTELINTKSRIYPVGRLDYDTTGLLIMTNDGDFANKLSHPSYRIEKTYLAKIDGHLNMEEYHKLKAGVMIDNKHCKALRLKIKKVDKEKNFDLVSITINVGINHVVKRMFAAVGHEVLKLKREQIGPLHIGDLKSGEYRILSDMEIKMIKSKS